MKDNKVHTVNKYNKVKWERPLFLSYGDDNQYGFGGSFLQGMGLNNLKSEFTWDGLGKALGQGVGKILGTSPDEEVPEAQAKQKRESSSGVDVGMPDTPNKDIANASASTTDITPNGGIVPEEEPQYSNQFAGSPEGRFAFGGPVRTEKGNLHFLGSLLGGGSGSGGKGEGGGLAGGISGIGSAIGGAIGGAISNGYTSGVGNVMNTVGKIASVIPGPWGAAISGGLQILGGGVNALFGTKVDQAKLQAANKGTNALNNFKSSAANFDAIKMATAQAGVQDAYSGGAFRKGWAEERNKRLHQQRIDARQFASRSVSNNINNLVSDQINNSLANYSAFGGPLFANGGRLFEIGGPTYGINNIPSEFYDIMDTSRQPEIDRLKEENAGFNVDDYFYRVKKQHPEVSKEQVVDAYNSIPIVASGSKVRHYTAGIYHPGDETGYGNRIMVYPSNMKADDGVGGYTKEDRISNNIAHEVNHMYMDKVLGGKYTDAEKKYMRAAFPKSELPENEERAYIMEFRNALSNQYNGAKEEALDKVLDKGASDDDVAYHWNQNVPEEMRIKKVKGKWDPKRIKAIREAGKYVAFNPTSNEASLFNMANYGGDLDIIEDSNSMDATRLNLAYDLIGTKRKNAENKNQMTNLFAGNQVPLFAFGGDMQSNSADWGTGLTHIDAGGSHEQNPNDGVQMGVDSEGTPNLVEEGEVIYNDYVYSARIPIDKITKEKFHFPRKKEMTYAEAAKKLEKEIAERPNDPLSQAGFKSQMETLAEQQERQKQEMEAERAKAAFEALSPEEQTAIMQRAAQDEQMAQQAAQEQTMAEQQVMQQPSPEEAAMAQQMQTPTPDEQAAMQQQQLAQMQANVSALGGQLVKAGDVEGNENLYALGDRLKKKTARKYGADWFKQLGKALGLTDDEMTEFLEGLNPNDPDANIAAFNAIYGNKQEEDARKRYMDAQRQSKRNELFGDNGMYRYSADKKYLYKGRTNDTDRTGYINRDYTGDEKDGSILGFLSVDDYNKKRADYEAETNANKKAALLKELEGYKPINEKAGDYMHDYQGKRIESLESDAEDKILDRYTSEYEKGFKWDPKEAQTVQYPVDMEHSNLSYLRYVPALSGAIGLFNDAINPTDYSRAQAVANLGNTSVPQISPNYKGNYLRYEPVDSWFWESPILASSRATDRAIMNTASPSKNAALIANGYNTTTALGQAGMQGQLQNFERKYRTTGFNNDLDKTFMNMDLYAQDANQKAAMQGARDANRYSYMGLAMMDDLDAKKNASINANLTNLMQSIGNIGEEAYDEDRLRWLERTGALRSNYYRKAKYGGNIDRNKLKL